MNIHEFYSVSFFSFAGSKKSAVLINVLCKNATIIKCMNETRGHQNRELFNWIEPSVEDSWVYPC